MTTILVNEAKTALALALDGAGAMNPVERYIALNRQKAATWFEYLQRAGLADRLDVWDVIAGKDALIADLIWQMPTGAGKSNPALLAVTP